MMSLGSEEMLMEQLPKRVSVLREWWYYMEKGRLPWNADTPNAEWYKMVLESLSADEEMVTRLRRVLERAAFRQRVSRQHEDEFLEALVGILCGVGGAFARYASGEPVFGSAGSGAAVSVSGAVGSGADSEGSSRSDSVDAAVGLGSALAGEGMGSGAGAVGTGAAAGSGAAGAGAVGAGSGFLGSLPVFAGGSRQMSLSQWVEAVCELCVWLEKKYLESLDLSRWISRRDRQGRLAKSLRRWRSEHARFLALPRAGRKAAVWELVLQEAARRPDAARAGSIVAMLTKWVSEDREIHLLLRGFGAGETAKQEGFDEYVKIEKKHERPAVEKDVVSEDDKEESIVAAEEERLFDKQMVDEDGFFGRLAGLILLHPFLTTLFGRCGFYDKNGFIDKEARQQAVFLLYYLGTGEKEGPEYEMLFPKILCGCDPEDPLPRTVELPESVYTEADDLLLMVLQRWEKLQHSSVGALREGFLQRLGKLVNRNDRLVLIMEISAIDVLLDYLPWNLSIVKFPWWKELLYVEWR